jgi:diguanylate cyclase (GGDEF)-like protein
VGQIENLLRHLGDAERETIEHELARLAFRDPLTGLANRTLFTQRLSQAHERAAADGTRLAVLFIDLDNFKRVNDSLGHAWGDEVLLTVAARLRSCLRAGDTAARLGGDEFTILIERVDDPANVVAIAERMAELLREPVELQGRPFFIGASIGIMISSDQLESPAELLRKADVAMYRAKTGGKGRCALFDSTHAAGLRPKLELESDLRMALERGELRIHYQPIVAVQDGAIRAVEALVRWHHPTRGAVPPSEFIPLAEETGLIVELGQWVLDQACLQAVRWQAERRQARPISMCVNLSPRQFQHPGLVDDIARTIAATGIAPRCLSLEITESVMVHEPELAVVTMRALRDMGVQLAVDDFGTGYSGLRYLRDFPVNTLKIDRVFIAGIDSDHYNSAIVQSVVTLAAALGLRVTAEGIETEAERRTVAALGCYGGQGYLFSRPLSAEAFCALLRRESAGRPGSLAAAA